jgi:nifR3 family TIM-barrel protein
MTNFWHNLKKPFFALAPMADVTDPAFRRLLAKYGKPDVTWTEFVSADGLSHPVGREKLLKDLAFTEAERPIVAQLFTSNPVNMRNVAKLCAELGFDGIDINMGCPDRTIEKQGCGSAMIKTPDKAVEIIQAAKDGIKDSGKEIPLSVKTRVGYNKEDIDNWIALLLKQDIAALTIHARTRKDMSNVPANWDYVSRVVKLKNEIAPNTIIIGNGDVIDIADGAEKAKATGCDGIMIGRACFGNPWIFSNPSVARRASRQLPLLRGASLRNLWCKLKKLVGADCSSCQEELQGETLVQSSRESSSETEELEFDDYSTPERYWLHNKPDVPLETKLRVLVEHSKLFCELLPHKNFATMKKHYKAYCHGFPGAKELRISLMESKDVAEVERLVDAFLKS